MPSHIVSYQLDDSTVARFEIDPPAGFQPAGADRVSGTIKKAISPAIEAAKIVLEKAREVSPDAVEVVFGIKVSGTTDWLVAKAASEANFRITLTWNTTDQADQEASRP